MKNTNLLVIIAVLILPFIMLAAQSTPNSKEIELMKETPSGPPRAPAAPAINAYLSGDFITINYLSDLGNVHIEVKDESESIVYKCTEPSGANNTSYIDLYSFESGLYTITITNDGSLYLQGVFEL